MIVGLIGKKHSGKNLFARVLQAAMTDKRYPYFFKTLPKTNTANSENYTIEEIVLTNCMPLTLEKTSQYSQKAFASTVKTIASMLTGIPAESMDNNEVKDTLLPKQWDMYVLHNYRGRGYGSFSEIFATAKDLLDKHPDHTTDTDIDIKSYKKSITLRQLLQWLGTEAGRDTIHPNIWVNALMRNYFSRKTNSTSYGDYANGIPLRYDVDTYPNWIITDVRFPNEVQAIKDQDGILIRIERPTEDRYPILWNKYAEYVLGTDVDFGGGFEKWVSVFEPDTYSSMMHPSETSLDGCDVDYTVTNNGGIPDLLSTAGTIIDKFKLL